MFLIKKPRKECSTARSRNKTDDTWLQPPLIRMTHSHSNITQTTVEDVYCLNAYGVEGEDGEGAGLGGDAAAECSHHTHLDLALDLLWSSSR